MPNDIEYYEALSRMAEEYQRILLPLREQIQFPARWNEIVSPVIRIAETNREILKGIDTFNTEVADKLREITQPFQDYFDSIHSISELMKTSFSELVHPEVYNPELAQTLSIIADTKMIPIEKYWQTNLKALTEIDVSVFGEIKSQFRFLAEIEREIAGLSNIANLCPQITCVSAQIASLCQVGIDETWKNRIVSPKMLDDLSSFAIKHYTLIKNSSDSKDIIWRLGLISSASKYTDAQVKWGTQLSAELITDVPNINASVPDYALLPHYLGSAKRDDKNVEELFFKSQIAEITDRGKTIINDYCRVQGSELIFPEKQLVDWAMTLSSMFCRNAKDINSVLNTLRCMFGRKQVKSILGCTILFDDLEISKDFSDKKPKDITKFQYQLYCQIISLEDEITETFHSSSLHKEYDITKNVLKALFNIQRNRLYKDKNENDINDGIRDSLSMLYEVKDQTRQGESSTGKDAGEIDLLLCNNGLPIAILEGLVLNSFKKQYFDEHISKVLTNYDPNGCPIVYILIYAKVARFDELWQKVVDHLSSYNYPYEIIEPVEEKETSLAESKHALVVLKRNNMRVSIHTHAISLN